MSSKGHKCSDNMNAYLIGGPPKTVGIPLRFQLKTSIEKGYHKKKAHTHMYKCGLNVTNMLKIPLGPSLDKLVIPIPTNMTSDRFGTFGWEPDVALRPVSVQTNTSGISKGLKWLASNDLRRRTKTSNCVFTPMSKSSYIPQVSELGH